MARRSNRRRGIRLGRRWWRIGPATLFALAILTPFGSAAHSADQAPATATTPAVFASKFSAQALTPTTNATLQVDDSMAWVHGFFNKSQTDSPINAAEYSEIFDPGFLAGAVIFAPATDPTPLSDPNNFPGYAWASYPVPANQTTITKCVTPTAMVPAPCPPGAPDQSISTIDPSAPAGSGYVTATGPGPGDTGGVFTASSTQGLKDGGLVVTSEAAGEHVSFAGGQLVLSGFRSVATTRAEPSGKVSASAYCVMGDVTIAGTTVTIGPKGQIDTSQLDPLLAQLDQATGKKFEILPPTKPVIAPGNHSIESSCQGPTVVINNPLPGPLGSLNVSQVFTLGVVDAVSGASDAAGKAAPVPGTSLGGLPTPPAVEPAASPAPEASPTSPAVATGLDTSTPPAGTTSAPAPPASGPAPTPPPQVDQLASAPRIATRRVNDPLVFSLTLASGLIIIGSSIGLRRTVGALIAARRDIFGSIG